MLPDAGCSASGPTAEKEAVLLQGLMSCPWTKQEFRSCSVFITFFQERQASCGWAPGSRQRTTLRLPKTRVLEQNYRIHDFSCPEILTVKCTDGTAAGILGGMGVVIAEGVSSKLQRQL